MDTIHYPLVCFPLSSQSVLGILLGANLRMVDKDVRSLKAAFSGHLHKQYKRLDEYPYMGLVEPVLAVIDVKVRPTYKETDGAYPLPNMLKVPIIAVHGENASGYYECHLPVLEQSFYYYDPKQFTTLLQHFATSILNNYTPNELYRIMDMDKPTLDIVTLRVDYDRNMDHTLLYDVHYPALTKVAERYPQAKAVKRNMSIFPDAAWELEDKVDSLLEKMLNQGVSVVVVGKTGTGKSAIIKQAIKKITTESKKQKVDFTFWMSQPQRITASAKYLGEWQKACEDVIQDLQSANGTLWMVDFCKMLDVGGEGPEDSVASFLASFIQSGHLQLIGEATPEEMESMRRRLPSFIDLFQTITVHELPKNQIERILEKITDYCQQNLKVHIAPDALSLAYRLLQRYYPYESFPGKAIKFLSQCVNETLLNKHNTLGTDTVIANFVKQTGMPELFLRDDQKIENNTLQAYFDSQVIGQPQATTQLCNIINIFKAGLNNPNKPIATLLFSGPTGVGKTQSAKALANFFFGKGQKTTPIVRVDMSEFQHPSHVTRFLGSGRSPSKLIQDIRERPFAVLLLDEIEKADPSIFDALLTMLDEGILVDGFGRTTNFRNTIIIMTSNIGASNRRSIGFADDQNPDTNYLSAIQKFFRPEFVNRIDHIIPFNALNAQHIHQITIKELDDLNQREGFAKRNIRLQFAPALINQIAQVGFDPKLGARPLQRAIERDIITPIASFLVSNPQLHNTTLALSLPHSDSNPNDTLRIQTLPL
jgi:ATP-dependent Clp protease ATP-binding subunit ClpC